MANAKNKRKSRASTAARPRPRPRSKNSGPVQPAQASEGEIADPDVAFDEVDLRDTLLSKMGEEIDLDIDESTSDEPKSEESDEVEQFRVGVPDFTAAAQQCMRIPTTGVEPKARSECKYAISRYCHHGYTCICSAPPEGHSIRDCC